jgi:hypothetical protein
MSFRKLGFAVLSASALLMSVHTTPASANCYTDRHASRIENYRHDDRGWYDNEGRYHRFERYDQWGWYDNDGYYHRFDDQY